MAMAMFSLEDSLDDLNDEDFLEAALDIEESQLPGGTADSAVTIKNHTSTTEIVNTRTNAETNAVVRDGPSQMSKSYGLVENNVHRSVNDDEVICKSGVKAGQEIKDFADCRDDIMTMVQDSKGQKVELAQIPLFDPQDFTNRRKRKFPGPAGALPKLKGGHDWMKICDGANESPFTRIDVPMDNLKQALLHNQTCQEHFTAEPWLTMKQELEAKASNITKNFSITTAIDKFKRRKLPHDKIPILCVLVSKIIHTKSDALVIFSDPSGEVQGILNRQLVQDHMHHLQPGTVIVLRQVGLFNPRGKSFYLNITPNNIVRLYAKSRYKDDTWERITMTAFIDSDFVIPILPPTPSHNNSLNRSLQVTPGACSPQLFESFRPPDSTVHQTPRNGYNNYTPRGGMNRSATHHTPHNGYNSYTPRGGMNQSAAQHTPRNGYNTPRGGMDQSRTVNNISSHVRTPQGNHNFSSPRAPPQRQFTPHRPSYGGTPQNQSPMNRAPHVVNTPKTSHTHASSSSASSVGRSTQNLNHNQTLPQVKVNNTLPIAPSNSKENVPTLPEKSSTPAAKRFKFKSVSSQDTNQNQSMNQLSSQTCDNLREAKTQPQKSALPPLDLWGDGDDDQLDSLLNSVGDDLFGSF